MPRPLPFLVFLMAALGLPACSSDAPAGTGVALRDPAALIDEIEGPLRLLVLPGSAYACDPATGMTTPHPPEERDADIPDAVVDVTFAVGESTEVDVAPGEWVILVRGWGTDEVSGREDFMIATGCAAESIANQETKEVSVELIANFGTGVCGDSILSPDEQCEDGNMIAGDGCDAACRSEAFQVARAPAGAIIPEDLPTAAWVEGSRLSVAYDSDNGGDDIRAMVLSETGTIITMPTALEVDGVVGGGAGPQTVASLAAGGGRFGVTYASFGSGPGEVFIRFYDQNRNALADAEEVHPPDAPGSQSDPAIGMMPDGAALVVFTDPNSSTGLSGNVVAAGETAPDTGALFEVGDGLTGGAEASVAGSSTGFVATFAAGGEVYYQRYGADGTPTDAAPVALPGRTGTRSAPALASLADGRTAIVFVEGSVKAQFYDATFAAVGTPVDVGPGSAPTVAASRERFTVAFVGGGGIMARMLAPDGTFALNRNQPPSTDAFPVATGAVTAPAAAAGGTADEPMWIVTWRDTGTDPTGDIDGRLFALP